jgi:hypothetical protein
MKIGKANIGAACRGCQAAFAVSRIRTSDLPPEGVALIGMGP